jgi:hypothetical protein
VSVTGPAGDAGPVSRVGDGPVGVLRTPGLYVAVGGGTRSTMAVNAGAPLLSTRSRPPPAGAGGARTVTAGRSGRPWWLYFAVAAFVLVRAEWWTWQRRITV